MTQRNYNISVHRSFAKTKKEMKRKENILKHRLKQRRANLAKMYST